MLLLQIHAVPAPTAAASYCTDVAPYLNGHLMCDAPAVTTAAACMHAILLQYSCMQVNILLQPSLTSYMSLYCHVCFLPWSDFALPKVQQCICESTSNHTAGRAAGRP